MKSIIAYLKQMLSDPNGEASTKRVISLIAAILIMVGYLANLFGDYSADDNFIDALMMIVVAGFGFSGIEKFATPKNATPEVE